MHASSRMSLISRAWDMGLGKQKKPHSTQVLALHQSPRLKHGESEMKGMTFTTAAWPCAFLYTYLHGFFLSAVFTKYLGLQLATMDCLQYCHRFKAKAKYCFKTNFCPEGQQATLPLSASISIPNRNSKPELGRALRPAKRSRFKLLVYK